MIALLLVLQQPPAPQPTVGDTIWIERGITVPAGAEVRPAPWDPGGDFALLGRPVVRRSGGQAIVAYPGVAWTAGNHTLSVPGPIVVRQDGRTDSLPAEQRTITVASVLPAGQDPARVPVQPAAGLVDERITTPWPLVTLLLGVVILLAPMAWWWRRRGPPMQVERLGPTEVTIPLVEWTEAGEHRAVAAVAARRLRSTLLGLLPGVSPGLVTSRLLRVVAEQRPAWPADELGTVLRALEAAQFAEVPGAEVVQLAERAGALSARLQGAA